MGGEPACDDPHRTEPAEAAGGTEHAELGDDVEAIAGLDLDGRGALGNQGIEAWQALGNELIFGRPCDGADGGEDAPPARAISA